MSFSTTTNRDNMTNNRIKMTIFVFPTNDLLSMKSSCFLLLSLCMHTQSTDLRIYTHPKYAKYVKETINKMAENQIALTVLLLTYTVFHFITSYLSISCTSIIYSFIFHWQKPFRLCWCSKASFSNLIFFPSSPFSVWHKPVSSLQLTTQTNCSHLKSLFLLIRTSTFVVAHSWCI